jgi:hypothetical protein
VFGNEALCSECALDAIGTMLFSSIPSGKIKEISAFIYIPI